MVKYVLSTILILNCFGLVGQETANFEHAIWQWVVGSEISDKRLNEVAPHFPHPKEVNYDKEKYDLEITRWQKLFCYEYEAFVNAPELVKLNPYYDGYQDIVQLPYFIRPLTSVDKPVKKSTGDAFNDELEHELDMQAWYFVFKPDEFYQIYKIKPEFPEWFDPEAFKASIKEKIKLSGSNLAE